MKTIQNKTITYIGKGPDEHFIKIVDIPTETDYFKLILESCSIQKQGGFSYEELKKINRVDNVLKDSDKLAAQFEDADFEFIKECVGKRTWNLPDIQFADFVDYIKEIK